MLFRSILNAIGMNLEIQMNSEQPNKTKISKMLQNIEVHTQHMSDTIDDFRNFFKPNKKKVQTNYAVLVRNSLALIDASIKNTNIEIIVDKEEITEMKTHQNEVMQVILNIIKNAQDALLERKISNPYIKISMYQNNNQNILEIRDNAGGIDNKIIDKIFDPYFSTKKNNLGTGIGLYMSKVIIVNHCKGELHVKNDSHGAVFTIIL